MCRSIDDLKTLKSDDITNREKMEQEHRPICILLCINNLKIAEP